MSELLLRVDNASVKRLKDEFDKFQQLSLEAFVQVICDSVDFKKIDEFVQKNVRKWSVAALEVCEDEHVGSQEWKKRWAVEQAIELFKQIDANGDGQVDWGEFSAFIIELNKTKELAKEDSEMIRMVPMHVKPDFKLNIQKRIRSFQTSTCGNKIALVEEASDQLKIHSLSKDGKIRFRTSVRVTSNFISHIVISGCVLESRSEAVVASQMKDSFYLSLYSLGQVVTQVEQIKTLSGQRIMRWHADSEILCTTGTARGDAKGCAVLVFKRNGRTGKFLEEKCTRLEWHYKLINTLEFVSHKHLVAGSLDGSCTIWDVQDGKLLSALNLHDSGIKTMSIFPLSPTLENGWSSFWARAKKDTLVAHIVSTPLPRFGEKVPDPEAPSAVVWHVSDKLKDISAHRELHGHKYPTAFVQIVPPTGLVVSCDTSGECRVWSPAQEYSCTQILRVGSPTFFWSTEKRLLFTVSAWSSHMKDQIFHFIQAERDRSKLIMCQFNQTMNCIVTGTKSEITVWDVQTGTKSAIFRIDVQSDKREIVKCCLDDRERKLIIGDDQGSLTVLNVMNGARIKSIDPHPVGKPITSLNFCKQDRILISTSWGGHIHLSDENHRQGHVPGKSSVKMRSIHMTDREGNDVDISCSAFSFHLKQIATFGEKKIRSEKRYCEEEIDSVDTTRPKSEGMLCIWDLEFARLSGLCETDPNAIMVSLAFVEPNYPNLLGLDIVSNTISLWRTHQENEYCNFDRLVRISLCGPKDTPASILQTWFVSPKENKMCFFVGWDDGSLSRHDVAISLTPLRRAVRQSTYRGNRSAYNKVKINKQELVQKRRKSIQATTPEDTTNPAPSRWLQKPPTNSFPTPTTMSFIPEDCLLLVGYEGGDMNIIHGETGKLCSHVDTFTASTLGEISGLNISRLKRERDRQVEQVLERLRTNAFVPTHKNKKRETKKNSPFLSPKESCATSIVGLASAIEELQPPSDSRTNEANNQDPPSSPNMQEQECNVSDDPMKLLFHRLRRVRLERKRPSTTSNASEQKSSQLTESGSEQYIIPATEKITESTDEKSVRKGTRLRKLSRTRMKEKRKEQDLAMARLSVAPSNKRPSTAPRSSATLQNSTGDSF